jgi:hypothetical protein
MNGLALATPHAQVYPTGSDDCHNDADSLTAAHSCHIGTTKAGSAASPRNAVLAFFSIKNYHLLLYEMKNNSKWNWRTHCSS